MHGSKFVYQTVPRMLSIWMDLADDKNVVVTSDFKKMTDSISTAMKEAPVYKVMIRVYLSCVTFG